MSAENLITQVEEKIQVETYNPMSRRDPSSRFWKVFAEWKKMFKTLNENIKELDKQTRRKLYMEYYAEYYRKYYTASC
jgi:hypothetical protein